MKKKFTYLIIPFVLLFGIGFLSSAFVAQPPSPSEKIYSDWRLIKENDAKLIDVFYRVIQCDTSDVIEVKVFNENSVDQTIEFELKVFDPSTQKSFTKDYKFDLTKGAMAQPICGTNTYSNLSIQLPNGYKGTTPLMLSIIFK